MTAHDPALTAEHDQRAAALRNLVQLVHEHRQSKVCDPHCPGMNAARVLTALSPGEWLNLLVAALIRVDDLQTGIGDAITAGNPGVNPLDRPWRP